MNCKITYEEIVYAKKLIKLVRKYLVENDVNDKDDIEAMANVISNLLINYKRYDSIKNKDGFNFVFRERVQSIKNIYGVLLSGRDIRVRVLQNDCEASKQHKNEKLKRLNNLSGARDAMVNLL